MLWIEANNGSVYNGINWAYHIKQIFERSGFSYMWLYHNMQDINMNIIQHRKKYI